MQACALGGVMSEVARKQAPLFARLNERFAARVAEAVRDHVHSDVKMVAGVIGE